MASRAIRFWGEEMGELWPPILAANAIAIYKNQTTGNLSEKLASQLDIGRRKTSAVGYVGLAV